MMATPPILDVPQEVIDTAAALIREGSVVAFPTETVYGLGADALDPDAVAKIFEMKGRPADNPLIVHVSDRSMLNRVVASIPPEAEPLMQRFWPGPLTIIMEKGDAVPGITTGGRGDVAIRMPDHPVALRLIAAAGVPIAAPSANRSGRPSPTSAAHVLEDFPGLMVIDGGETRHGLESTVISLAGTPALLRLGAVTLEQLREVIPGIEVRTKAAAGEAPQSPGQKYRHYAPSVPMRLFTDIEALKEEARKHHDATILCKEGHVEELSGLDARVISLGKDEEEFGRNIYAALRSTKEGILLVLGVERRGIGSAIMDRLERAAHGPPQ